MDPEEKGISVSRQCELLNVPRSSHYEGACKPEGKTETEFNLKLMGAAGLRRSCASRAMK